MTSETIRPEQLTALAQQLESTVGPLLDQAAASLGAATIAGSAFSNAGLAMQVVYPGLRDWAVRDARTEHDELDAVRDKLRATAALWSDAESSSTVALDV